MGWIIIYILKAFNKDAGVTPAKLWEARTSMVIYTTMC